MQNQRVYVLVSHNHPRPTVVLALGELFPSSPQTRKKETSRDLWKLSERLREFSRIRQAHTARELKVRHSQCACACVYVCMQLHRGANCSCCQVRGELRPSCARSSAAAMAFSNDAYLRRISRIICAGKLITHAVLRSRKKKPGRVIIKDETPPLPPPLLWWGELAASWMNFSLSFYACVCYFLFILRDGDARVIFYRNKKLRGLLWNEKISSQQREREPHFATEKKGT